MKEIALEVKDLYITYSNLHSYSIKKGLLKGKKTKKDLVEAVKGVSFSLEKGSILGIVGKNGSGKSTMLKAIAGIFSPDSGEVDLKGNTISLMSIGVGFNKELTGRENIALSGMLLGFEKDYVLAREEDIIAFSELGKFIDYPVRTYSSGMHSKLAFAISVMLETSIILVDEVLSVGDARFRKKSFAKMQEIIKDDNRTVIIVSHNMSTLKNLCNKILWINEGNMMMIGDTKEVLPKYEAFMESLNEETIKDVSADDPLEKAVRWAVREKHIRITDEGLFKPDKECVKQDLAMFLWRYYGKEISEGKLKYSDCADIKKDNNRYKSLVWALNKNIVKAKDGNKFGLKESVTISDVLKAMFILGGQPEAEETALSEKCNELDKDSLEYKALVWAVSNNLISEENRDKLDPAKAITRKEFAGILYNHNKIF